MKENASLFCNLHNFHAKLCNIFQINIKQLKYCHCIFCKKNDFSFFPSSDSQTAINIQKVSFASKELSLKIRAFYVNTKHTFT